MPKALVCFARLAQPSHCPKQRWWCCCSTLANGYEAVKVALNFTSREWLQARCFIAKLLTPSQTYAGTRAMFHRNCGRYVTRKNSLRSCRKHCLHRFSKPHPLWFRDDLLPMEDDAKTSKTYTVTELGSYPNAFCSVHQKQRGDGQTRFWYWDFLWVRSPCFFRHFNRLLLVFYAKLSWAKFTRCYPHLNQRWWCNGCCFRC